MICTKTSFSVLACVCLVAQVSAITPRTSINDFQPKNAKPITRAAAFAQKNAIYGAATAYALTTAISANEEKRIAAGALLTKEFVKTGFSCRGWTVANGLAKCLNNRLQFLKKRALAYNFLRDLGKEFFGNGLNEILFTLALEEYFDAKDALKDLFVKNRFLDILRAVNSDAFKTVASSKSDTPLSKALLIDLSVHALPNMVSEKEKNSSLKSVIEKGSVFDFFNQINLQKISVLFNLFCKHFRYQEGNTLIPIAGQMVLTRITEICIPCSQSHSDNFVDNLAQKLANHSVKSLIKTTYNNLPWQAVYSNLNIRFNKIRARHTRLLTRSSQRC